MCTYHTYSHHIPVYHMHIPIIHKHHMHAHTIHTHILYMYILHIYTHAHTYHMHAHTPYAHTHIHHMHAHTPYIYINTHTIYIHIPHSYTYRERERDLGRHVPCLTRVLSSHVLMENAVMFTEKLHTLALDSKPLPEDSQNDQCECKELFCYPRSSSEGSLHSAWLCIFKIFSVCTWHPQI